MFSFFINFILLWDIPIDSKLKFFGHIDSLRKINKDPTFGITKHIFHQFLHFFIHLLTFTLSWLFLFVLSFFLLILLFSLEILLHEIGLIYDLKSQFYFMIENLDQQNIGDGLFLLVEFEDLLSEFF